MDADGESVFERTIEWAVGHGVETATFHILTPYPGTELYARMKNAGRIVHSNWDLYDTRHVVYRPARLSPQALEEGYWRAYKDFYRWGNILRGASTKPTLHDGARHAAYSGGWKRLEPMWDWVVRAKRVSNLLPVLENVLAGFGKHPSQKIPAQQSPENKPASEEPSSPSPVLYPLARKR